MKKYCVQVSPQTSQPFARADGDRLDRLRRTRRGRRRAARPRHAASWIARFVASPSVSGGRVSACQLGSRLAGRERLLHEHVDRIAVLGVDHHERAGLRRDCSIARKSVSSSTISAPL